MYPSPVKESWCKGVKKIKINFEALPALKGIEVLFRASEKDAQVEELMDRVLSREPARLLFFDNENNARMVAADEIILISVNGKQINIVTENDRYFAKQSLQSIERELDDTRFIRISRHEIINLSKVNKYNFSLGGVLSIEMKNGMETWASRRCIPLIRKKLLGKE